MLLFLDDLVSPQMSGVVSGQLDESSDVGCHSWVALMGPRNYLEGVACVSRVLVLCGCVMHFVSGFGHGVA